MPSICPRILLTRFRLTVWSGCFPKSMTPPWLLVFTELSLWTVHHNERFQNPNRARSGLTPMVHGARLTFFSQLQSLWFKSECVPYKSINLRDYTLLNVRDVDIECVTSPEIRRGPKGRHPTYFCPVFNWIRAWLCSPGWITNSVAKRT